MLPLISKRPNFLANSSEISPLVFLDFSASFSNLTAFALSVFSSSLILSSTSLINSSNSAFSSAFSGLLAFASLTFASANLACAASTAF